MGHENAEGMAHVGVRVEPPVRLGSEVEGFKRAHCCNFLGVALHVSIFGAEQPRFRSGQRAKLLGAIGL